MLQPTGWSVAMRTSLFLVPRAGHPMAPTRATGALASLARAAYNPPPMRPLILLGAALAALSAIAAPARACDASP